MNLGGIHDDLGELDQAVSVFRDLIAGHPDFAAAYNCLAIALLHQRHPAEALLQFEEAVKRSPNDAEVHLNQSMCLLALGEFERGWREYEWRWKVKNRTPCPIQAPAWDGSALPQKTILLWHEQGMGDGIQFIRYAALVKERVGKVLLLCPPPLRALFSSCPGVDELITEGKPLPPADVQAPLLGLPRLLGTTLSNVPATVPYLFVNDTLREQWREKVGAGRGLKVGLAWQGNPNHSGDRQRSMALEQLRPLADVPGVRLFSLQKGAGAEQLAALQESMRITDLAAQISGGFDETAAAVLNLDVVVTIDSSVAHLAGALGVPVFVLLSYANDWRWLLHRSDSPWYPSTRLFRQETWGDWPGVVSRVASALADLARKSHAAAPAAPPPAEVLDRLIRDEAQRGWSEQSWSALRQAGLPQTDEAAALAEQLRFVHEGLAAIERSMCSEPGPNGEAAELIRSYALARQRRDDLLRRFPAALHAEPDTLRSAQRAS